MLDWVTDNFQSVMDNQVLIDEKMNSLLSLMQAYSAVSAILIIAVFVLGIVVLYNQKRIIKQNEYIMKMIESRTLRGGEKKNE